MIIDFDSNNDKKKTKEIKMETGNFETQMKLRKKQVPKIEASIQEILKDYSGESITIIVQKEDENGQPDHARILMAGVSQMESQLAMSRALDRASDQAVEILLEGAKGDTQALIKIGIAMMQDIANENKKGK